MSKIIIRNLIACFFILLLAGCAAKYEKYYEFKVPASAEGEQCIETCNKTKQNCQNMCTNDTSLCQKNMMLQAKLEYGDYIKEKRTEGSQINRDLNSFYDPLQCSKISCDCDRDYRACYRMCGGKVKVKKRCIANCSN